MALSAGTQLGPYRILSPIGAGGMGEVYRARDARLDRIVAIKLSQEKFSERFDHEARAVAALNHPNICTLHDVGPNYLVMELVEGDTLRECLRRGLPSDRCLPIARQVLEALSAAHHAGVIHRDLKPENIMVRADGYVKVLDFGLAKRMPAAAPDGQTGSTATIGLTQPGHVIGTAAYMSPEQIQGLAVDHRSDIFSLGILLYEMLAGRHPWRRLSPIDTLHAVLHDDPPPIDPPIPALERVLWRCLAKQPEWRYPSIDEVRAALDQSATDTAAAPARRHPSIAVLPFANMSADKENDYFSDGLAEEVINVLAHVPGMKVAGRTSSFFFRGKDVEFAEIGRRLNVEHILEGSVRAAGNRIRVTAQLIKVTDGFHIWSERYDREKTDIFAIQDEITQAIAEALLIKLSPEGDALRRHAPDLRAYDAYLKAREQWCKGTPQALAKLKEFIDRAIELDPQFALAYSLLGGHYTMLANLGIRDAREVVPLARAAEQEALRIDPSLPEARALLAVCHGMDYEWNEAERHWRLALAREPVSRDLRFWYGNHYLLPLCRPVEAVEAMAPGVREDPLNHLYRHHYAVGLRQLGRLDDAAAELRKILEVDGDFGLAVGTLGAVRAQQGRFDEALALTERAHALTPWRSVMIGQLAALLARAGESGRANALLAELESGSVSGAAAGQSVYYALTGDLDRAASCAASAIEERFARIVPVLAPLLRPTSAWPALAKLMKLPG